MSLTVKSIAFRDFRNYERFSLDDLGPLTVLVGPNAVGKTNIVEGIQLVTALDSFRHPTIEQMVRDGAQAAFLEANVADGNRWLTVSLDMHDHVKRYSLNGKAKKTQDLKGLVPAVSFTPDDLELVKGSMSVRRTALDALGSQLSPNHYLIKKDYEKVIRYKNRLLKEEAPLDLVASMDEVLVTCGAQLMCYRVALMKKLVAACVRCYASIAQGGEALSVRYIPSWAELVSPVRAGASFEELSDAPGEFSSSGASFSLARDDARTWLAAALAARRGEEAARKRSLVGPHADRVEFRLDGKDATLYGSQGQQRSIVLAFKLAEAAVIEEVLNQKPVMLLDDVMSELDENRRAALVSFIADDVQTFITTANLQYFDSGLLDRANVVKLPRQEG